MQSCLLPVGDHPRPGYVHILFLFRSGSLQRRLKSC